MSYSRFASELAGTSTATLPVAFIAFFIIRIRCFGDYTLNLESKPKDHEYDMNTSAKTNQPAGIITIRSARRQADSDEQLPSFEVHVQVELDGRKVAWSMVMLPGAQVPIQLDESQRVILIVHEQELLIDSSQVDRTYSLVVQDTDQNGQK